MVGVWADVVRTPRVSEDERACTAGAVEAACRLQLPPYTNVALALSNSHLDLARRAEEAGDARVVEQIAVGCVRAPSQAAPRRRRWRVMFMRIVRMRVMCVWIMMMRKWIMRMRFVRVRVVRVGAVRVGA